ncbi:MAG: cytidine deaminase [Clostridiales bacterium]|nr:cytidine deaminase [Clostridiales bacterium]
MNYSELASLALKARAFAYAPYSEFYVGAALLDIHGRITTGVNIENSSFGATICAERSAVARAISTFDALAKNIDDGIFRAIAIAGGTRAQEEILTEFAYPCGICRQVLSEFATEDMQVIVVKSKDEFKVFKLHELIPYAFTKESL